MTENVFMVDASTLRDIRAALKDNKKIQAIKILRYDVNCGLREAKQSIELYDHDVMGNTARSVDRNAAKIVPRAFIRSVTFDIGQGELTVDLEEMEMRALMGLDAIGINEIARVLDLVKLLKAFSEGADIDINGALKTIEDESTE